MIAPLNHHAYTRLISGFAQDEFTIVPDRVAFTLGSKVEHNNFSGWDVQPNARLLWTPHARHSIWSSAAHAVRTPSYGERNVNVLLATMPPLTGLNPSPYPVEMLMTGSPDFGSEQVDSYELGYRIRPTGSLGLTIDAFYNDYDRLRTFRLGDPIVNLADPVPHITVPMGLVNEAYGYSRGLEFTVDYRPLHWWRVLAAYSGMRAHLQDKGEYSGATSNTVGENIYPEHQAWARLSFDLARHYEIDLIPRYVSAQRNSTVGEFYTADLRVNWRAATGFNVYVAGQDLLGGSHFEFDMPYNMQTVASKTDPQLYLGAVWQLGDHHGRQ